MAENNDDVASSTSKSTQSSTSLESISIHKSCFKIIHYNAQSLNTNTMTQITAEASGFDVIAVSETWFKPETENVSIPGYHNPVRKDRLNKIGGGVALYVKDTHCIKPRLDLEVPNIEAVWCEVRFHNKKALICAMYREPRSLVADWGHIEDALEQAKLTGITNILIFGDLNDDPRKPKSKLASIMNDYHLSQLITSPTHGNSLIDVALTTSPDIILDSGTLPPSIINNKHCPIYVTTKFKLPKEKPHKRKIYLYNKADWDGLKKAITEANWEEVFDQDDIDSMANKWTQLYTTTVEKHIPTKIVKIYQKDAPWMTTALKKCIQKRNKAYKKAKRTNLGRHWEKFRMMRNKAAQIILDAKISSNEKLEKQINESCETNDRLWWKLVKQILNKNGSSRRIPPLIEDDKTVTEDREKAEVFNKYFADQSNIDTTGAPPLDTNFTKDNPLERITVSFLDVEKVLLNLKINTASGPDGISTRMLKMTARQIAPSLARLFNFSLRTSTYPSA